MAKLSLPRFATGLLGVFFAVALGKRGGRTMVFSLGCFQLLPQILIFSFQLVGDLEICRGRCWISLATTGAVLLSQISNQLPKFPILVLQWNDGIGRGSHFGRTGLTLANHRLLTKALIFRFQRLQGLHRKIKSLGQFRWIRFVQSMRINPWHAARYSLS